MAGLSHTCGDRPGDCPRIAAGDLPAVRFPEPGRSGSAPRAPPPLSGTRGLPQACPSHDRQGASTHSPGGKPQSSLRLHPVGGSRLCGGAWCHGWDRAHHNGRSPPGYVTKARDRRKGRELGSCLQTSVVRPTVTHIPDMQRASCLPESHVSHTQSQGQAERQDPAVSTRSGYGCS